MEPDVGESALERGAQASFQESSFPAWMFPVGEEVPRWRFHRRKDERAVCGDAGSVSAAATSGDTTAGRSERTLTKRPAGVEGRDGESSVTATTSAEERTRRRLGLLTEEAAGARARAAVGDATATARQKMISSRLGRRAAIATSEKPRRKVEECAAKGTRPTKRREGHESKEDG